MKWIKERFPIVIIFALLMSAYGFLVWNNYSHENFEEVYNNRPEAESVLSDSVRQDEERITPQNGDGGNLDREKRDLQIADHKAQIWMARYALAGVVLGIAGAFMLFWTLRYTRDAANAARDTLEIARKTMLHQLKAYLDIDARIYNLKDTPEYILIKVVVKNRGQTPALNLTMNIINVESGDDCILPVISLGPNTIDPAGFMSFPFRIDKKWRKSVLKDGVKFHYTIGFMDVFGEERIMMARLGVLGDDVPNSPKVLRGVDNSKYVKSKSIGIFFQADDIGFGAAIQKLQNMASGQDRYLTNLSSHTRT